MNVRQAPFDAARSTGRVVLIYVFVGVLWIALSSGVARRLTNSADALARFEALKGWAFVLVTGLVLYGLLRHRAAMLARSQSAVRARDTLIEHVLSSGPVVMYRMELHDGRPAPTWVSGSVERLFGYAPAETLVPGWWDDHLHPDDRSEALRAGAGLAKGHGVEREYRLRTKRGGYRWIRDVNRVVPGADGPPEVLGAWIDVTEQREARQALQERELFYRSLIENASDTSLLLDVSGTVLYASPSIDRHTGFSTAEFLGRNAFGMIHPDDLARVQAAFGRAAAHPGDVISADYRLRHADGTWREISSVGRLLPGDPPRLVVNSRDITESRTVEEQLRQAQKLEAVGQLTAGIVHDFNNVLSVVMGNAELLLGELSPALVEPRQDVEHIKEAAQSGADMVRKLLGFSRQAALRMVPLDLRPVLRDVEAMLRRVLPSAIAVTVDVPDGVSPVRADIGAIQQIILNLATNARDAMPDGGRLCIAVADAALDEQIVATHPWVVPGRCVRLSVTDTGTGMDARTRARIFDPFFTTKPVGKGTGLGMAMILGLVKQHGGMVDVDTEVGRGTTVSVSLPVATDRAPARGPTEFGQLRGGTETILLAEDHDVLRRTGTRILEKLGYRVEAVEDGRQCLEILDARGADIDLVISDVQMPRLTGIQLYRELSRRGSTVPFLFSSGEAAARFHEEHRLEDVGFVQKPWTIEEVARAARAALDRGASGPASRS